MTIVLLSISGGLLFLALSTRGRTVNEAEGQLSVFMVGVAILTFGFALQLAAVTLPGMLLWNLVMYLGFAVIMLAMGLLLRAQMQPGAGEEGISIMSLSLVPAIVLIILASDPWTGLFYSSIEVSEYLGQTYLLTVRTWGYFLMWAYITVLAMIMIHTIIQGLRGVTDANVYYNLVILTGLLAALVLSSLPTGLLEIPTALIVSLSLSAIALPLSIVASRYGTFTWRLSFQDVLDLSNDMKIILDLDARIVYRNELAASAIRVDESGSIMNGFKEAFSAGEPVSRVEEFEVNTDAGPRVYQLTSVPLQSHSGRLYGHLLTFKDVTRVVGQRRSLIRLNERIRAISGASRHDMINQITALNGLVFMLEGPAAEAGAIKPLQSIQNSIDTIHRQLVFMEDYEMVGSLEPHWMPLRETVEEAIEDLDTSSLSIELDIRDVSILADPLLVKVFINLIHNSLVHGDELTWMSFSTAMDGPCLLIHYRDDGGGIRPEYREGLFSQGVGRNSGLGLFLSQRILGITGITIHEEGTAGSGVDFVIKVPDGRWQYSSDR